jgi:predicted alpha/beta hydrolase
VNAESPQGREMHLHCADGRALAATLYEPAGPPRLAVQINPGMGIPRRFYRFFATWLAAQGCTVVTYDNRGVGGSLRGPSGHDDFTFSDWGAQDQAAASRFLLQHCPKAPLVLVSHSKGAQLMGFSPLLGEARAVFTQASQYFTWTRKDWAGRLRMWSDSLVNIPRGLRRQGFFVIPRMLDVPPAAARELQRWYLHPQYFCDARGRRIRPHYGDLRAPLRHVVFTDDELIRRVQQAQGLITLYPNARATFEHAAPADFGAGQVGHLGFFRPTMPEAGWRIMLDWLLANAR